MAIAAKVSVLVTEWVVFVAVARAQSEPSPAVDADLLRALAAAHASEQEDEAARDWFELLLASDAATAADFARATVCELQRWSDSTRFAPAIWFAGRAIALAPRDPIGWLALARAMLDARETKNVVGGPDFERELRRRLADADAALAAIAALALDHALLLAPHDAELLLRRAALLQEFEADAAAQPLLERILRLGMHVDPGLRLPAEYRLAELYRHCDDPARRRCARTLRERRDLWFRADERLRSSRCVDDAGQIRFEPPAAVARIAAPASVPTHARWQRLEQPAAVLDGSIRSLAVADLDGDLRDDLVGCDARGLFAALQSSDGRFAVRRLLDGDFHAARPVVLERDQAPSIVVRGDERVRLLSPLGGGDLIEETPRAGLFAANARAMVAVDFDFDGDLDLVVATDDGLHRLRNDGCPDEVEGNDVWCTGPMRLVDLDAARPQIRGRFDWIEIEDVDGDGSTDLLAGGPSVDSVVALQSRHPDSAPRPAALLGLPRRLATRPLLADLDHDARVDLITASDDPVWLRNLGDGRFDVARPLPWLASVATHALALEDVDLDGELDLVAARPDGELVARMGPLLAADGEELVLARGASSRVPPLLADLDQDGDLDVVVTDAERIVLHAAIRDPARRSLHLRLEGVMTSDDPVGAIVEARFGDRVDRRFVRGHALVLGLGDAQWPDVLRLRWPVTNGRDQYLVGRMPPRAEPPASAFASHDHRNWVWVRRRDDSLQQLFEPVPLDPWDDDWMRDHVMNLAARKGFVRQLWIRRPDDPGPLIPRDLGGEPIDGPAASPFVRIWTETIPTSGPGSNLGPPRRRR